MVVTILQLNVYFTHLGNPTQRGVMQWSPKGEDHHGFLSESGIDQLFFGENEEGEGDDNYDV